MAAFPSALRSKYDDQKQLGQGSFGQVWRARDISSGQVVAIKIFIVAGSYVTWGMVEQSPRIKAEIADSEAECQFAIDIQKQDPDDIGSAHIMRCLTDGIKLGKQDKQQPLYLVLEYAGRTTFDDWVTSKQRDWVPSSLHYSAMTPSHDVVVFRRLVQELFLGLQYMTNKDHATKFVHHDLKGMNVAVDENEMLKIIDLGTGISSEKPDEKTACTVLIRPPETRKNADLGQGGKVGAAKPWHSYDVYSAGVTITGMVAGTGLEYEKGKEFPIPQMVRKADLESKLPAVVDPRNIPGVADCFGATVTRLKDDPKASSNIAVVQIGAFYECFAENVHRAQYKLEVEMFEAASKGDDPTTFYSYISCDAEPGVRKELWKDVLNQWYDTGFWKVAVRMLDPDPTTRVSPKEVLSHKWMSPTYLCEHDWCEHGDTRRGVQKTFDVDKLQCEAEAPASLVTLLVLIYVIGTMQCCGGCCCLCGTFKCHGAHTNANDDHPRELKFFAVCLSLLGVSCFFSTQFFFGTNFFTFIAFLFLCGVFAPACFFGFCGPSEHFGVAIVASVVLSLLCLTYNFMSLGTTRAMLGDLEKAYAAVQGSREAEQELAFMDIEFETGDMMRTVMFDALLPLFGSLAFMTQILPLGHLVAAGMAAFRAYNTKGFFGKRAPGAQARVLTGMEMPPVPPVQAFQQPMVGPPMAVQPVMAQAMAPPPQ